MPPKTDAPTMRPREPVLRGGFLLDPVAIGLRIKRRREQLDLSQREVTAGLKKVSYAYVSRLEHAARIPSLTALAELGRALSVRPLWLAFGSRPPEHCPLCGQPTAGLEQPELDDPARPTRKEDDGL